MTDHSYPSVVERVRTFIIDNYLYMRPNATVSEGDSLLAKGIVDSMGVMELVAFLEDEFGVTMEDVEITEANLGSLGAISRFVVDQLSREQAHLAS
jgi:acyl carrier protein